MQPGTRWWCVISIRVHQREVCNPAAAAAGVRIAAIISSIDTPAGVVFINMETRLWFNYGRRCNWQQPSLIALDAHCVRFGSHSVYAPCLNCRAATITVIFVVIVFAHGTQFSGNLRNVAESFRSSYKILRWRFYGESHFTSFRRTWNLLGYF